MGTLFQPKKCANGEDGITQLPDDILIGILCWLPPKEAVLTSAVSSRWRNLWKYTSRLNFDACSVVKSIMFRRYVEIQKYVEFVNQFVQSHKAPSLKEFRVRCYFDRSWATTITKWLEFAFSRQVEMLELEVLYDGGVALNGRYVFTEQQLLRQNKCKGRCPLKALSFKGVDVSEKAVQFLLYNCPLLKQLAIDWSYLIINLEVCSPTPLLKHVESIKVSTPNLSSLAITNVSVTDEAFEFFLHNCPLLEELVIHSSDLIINLEVCSPSPLLKHLEIVDCDNVESIKVSAPNLSSLAIPLSFTTYPGFVLFENVSSLVQLSADCLDVRYFPNNLVHVFSSCYSQLEVLTLTSIDDLNSFSAILDNLNFPQLKRLEIDFSLPSYQDPSLYDLISFIRASPYLQEFVLQSSCHEGISSEGACLGELCHKHLKVFKFLGYFGSCGDDLFIRFISRNCVVLEKIVIHPHHQYPYAVHSLPPGSSTTIKKQELMARIHANKLIEEKVPHHIQLIII